MTIPAARKPALAARSRRAPPGRLDARFAREALALAEQSAGVGVWSIDLTTGIVRGTAQFFRIMGLGPTTGGVPIDAIRAVRHPDDRERVLAGFCRALEDGSDAYEIEYRIVRPDGEVRWIFGRGRVVRDRESRPVRYSGVDLDVTDRKSAQAELAAAKEALERMNQALEERVRARTAELEREARLRSEAEHKLSHAQKMEAVGQLTGGVAHDFNNLLQVILGNLQIATMLLSREAEAPAGMDRTAVLQGSIEKAEKASRSAAQLVQRLLAFSRRQQLEPASVDANGLIADMADMIQRTLGETIAVQTVLAPQPWPAFVDRSQLETALLNLVVNARDAMPDGGRLVIETVNVTVEREAVEEDLLPGEYVLVSVTDTGSGIPPDILARVFEPFFTTKETGKGSGLGLSMVYGFVKQSGGHVRIASELGAGSTVRLYLPRTTEPAAPDGDITVPAGGRLASARPGETILLVEDNDEVRQFGVFALQDLGYRVLHAADGPAALRLLDGVAPRDVHLLFTDVVLPGGMSGRALADAAVARRPDLPVLFTSGFARTMSAEQNSAALRMPVLGKPYSIESLASTVRRAIDRGAVEAAAD